MFQLAKLDTQKGDTTFEELSKDLGVPIKWVKSFFERQKMNGDYRIKKNKGVTEKVFQMKDVHLKINEYIDQYRE